MKQQRKQKHVGCVPEKASMDYTEWRDNLKSFTFEVYLLSKDRPLFSLQFSLLTIKGINPSPSLRTHSASCLSFWMAAFRHRTSPTYRASVLQPDWLAVKYFDSPHDSLFKFPSKWCFLFILPSIPSPFILKRNISVWLMWLKHDSFFQGILLVFLKFSVTRR